MEYSVWLHVAPHALTIGMPSDAERTERNFSSVVTIVDVICSAAADRLPLGMCRNVLHAEPSPDNRAAQRGQRSVFQLLFLFLGSCTIGLLSPVQRVVVGRDDDPSGIKVEPKIDAITRLESKHLEMRVDGAHPWHVRLAILGKVRLVAEGQLNRWILFELLGT
ncbi:hypothetical protein WI44_13910 [Burkholderia cepacia]|nr:hypothetical protein WI45_28875 [Burkholderia cepacia]KVA35146.1 hypothetical protein WI44_13910 [Burkholderia cepacia]